MMQTLSFTAKLNSFAQSSLAAKFGRMVQAHWRAEVKQEESARMSAGSQVIRATEVFTKHGKSKQVSLLREIGAGLTLGLAFGLVWKVSLVLHQLLLCIKSPAWRKGAAPRTEGPL